MLTILASFLLSMYYYQQLPDEIASHWNSSGEVDDYLPKFWGLFLIPFTSLGILILFWIIPKIDPLKKNIASFRKYFDFFLFVLLIYLLYIQILTIIWSLGITFNMNQAIIPALGILIYSISYLIENAKRNWFIGIRTPWTLSNDKVWEKTHKLGGKLFKISGITIFIVAFIPKISFLAIFIILAVALYLVIYSYIEYKKTNR